MFIPSKAPMSTKNVEISSAQCRAGRALLDMTQTRLAELAELGLSTVVDYEKMRRKVSAVAIEAIRNALRRAGVDFIDENGGGPGVRLRKRQPKKS
jgi:transcriptional regulator with XRE-family HTH domain